MPSAYAMIRRCAGLSAAKRLRVVRLRRAKWAASRLGGGSQPAHLICQLQIDALYLLTQLQAQDFIVLGGCATDRRAE
jgi:hypothetical protein